MIKCQPKSRIDKFHLRVLTFVVPGRTVLVTDWPFELVGLEELLLARFSKIAGVYKTVVASPIAGDAIIAGLCTAGFTTYCVSFCYPLPASTTPSFWSIFGTIFTGTTATPPSASTADFATGS
jgi:hypothetical protein